jgi:valyl-tRNA synthetase
MKSREIPKSYGPGDEIEIYKIWEASGYFNPDNVDSQQKPFVITLPPPNANAELHVGTTCGYSFQDAMGRYHRMKGRPTLLLPGKDHAGIQTETVFTKKLKEEGIDKWEIGREEFYKRSYEFCMDNAEYARSQEKRLGLSADWSREKFTLDPKLSEIVFDTFVKMFDEGLIYRGSYIINQCTNCGTALADVDTDHVMKKGIFAYIKYPLSDDKDKYITVATTRPETMLGDTAVAVNPDDQRYKDLVGKMVDLPLTDRQIPIIADEGIDIDLGTGALKVTPAHASIDFEMGQKHGLEMINVIDHEGKMNNNVPDKYQGMTVYECRDSVVEDLEKEGYLEKVEDIEHEVVVCERCQHTIEQIISNQWFVNVKPLAEEAIKAIDEGKTKVVPDNQEKVLRHWFENIRPWCISRQLWWGHRIPIWYCGSKELYDWLQDNPEKTKEDFEKETGKKADGCGCVVAGVEKPDKCSKCKCENFEQETDVFDTWFSSGQWPFSTMGGVDGEDFKKFYPTDVLETMYDILFFWVARMMMLGIYRTGETPFHTVYLHGMILAPDGQKMSKSKGNGVMPQDVFDEYGADALRLWYYLDTRPATPSPIRYEKLQGNRNFVNKIWNASRFVMFQVKDLSDEEMEQLDSLVGEHAKKLHDSDDEWTKSLSSTVKTVDDHIQNFRFNLAVEEAREYFWHTFCDKYIEETKQLIENEPDKKLEYLARLISMLVVQMKLLHPFAPFVTEKVWQSLIKIGMLGFESDILMMSKWPV